MVILQPVKDDERQIILKFSAAQYLLCDKGHLVAIDRHIF